MGHGQHQEKVLCTSVRWMSFPSETDVTASQEVHYNEEILHNGLIRGANLVQKNELAYSPGVGGCLGQRRTTDPMLSREFA